ncbi:uncharacterized protein LOC135708850 [Ochlerotatus camptorhynchus]|uniref:uncharacterized protein LOC135708850 n=1 Tax=Ochlerotatus camptorhynchus TaxID=644619 RepID=UPI0031E27A45
MDALSNRDCLLCDAPDGADENMVQCDDCKLWVHFRCAEVDESIRDKPWSCPQCMNRLRVPEQTKQKKSTKKSGSGSKSDAGSVKSLVSVIEELEKEQFAKEKALEEERVVREKRMEMEKVLKEKRMKFEREMREKELKQERELQEKELLQEREMLERRLAAEEDFLKKQHTLRERFQNAKEKVSGGWKETDGAVGGHRTAQQNTDLEPSVGLTKSEVEHMVQNWLQNNGTAHTKYPLGAYPKGTVVQENTVHSKKKLSKLEQLKALLEQEDSQEEEDSKTMCSSDDEESHKTSVTQRKDKRHRGNGSGQRLSQEQLAARQYMSKQLPIFKGEPEVWPLFISSFENTTNACGFSNLDNLKRLQDCLQGEALEAVRSRLVMPESVPDVLNDLRNLFGKPEKLLKALLTKVRKAPSPKIEQLGTFIHFGITVKQLCDHLEAAGLADHLNNPMLVQELVDKLPPSYKLDWVRYKRYSRGTPLRMFTDFISDVVSDVSEVADYTGANLREAVLARNRNDKRKEFVHMHNTSSKGETPQGNKVAKPCWMCKRLDHKVRFCDDFKKLNVTERLRLVENLKLCVLCLNAHGKSRCSFKLRCNVGDCQEYHHPLLHRARESVQVVECNAHNRLNRSVIFRMVPVTLSVGDLSLDTLAFLDEGSSVTLVEDIVVNHLQVKGVPEPLIVSWTGNMKRYEDGSRRVNLMLAARGSSQKLLIQGARTVSELVLPKQDVRFQDITERYPHLRDLPIMESGPDEPKIMIGQPGEPIGVRTKLGWTIYGPEKLIRMEDARVNFHTTCSVTNQELHDIIRVQYSLEEMGVPASAVPESNEDRRAREILRTTTTRVGDQFETGLLWRRDARSFPDSYGMAKRRLIGLERKLAKDPQLQEVVRRQIKEYQMKKYAHIATQEELAKSDPATVWYLPLNVVKHPHKPEKVRLVWDAAARVQGVSLNSELLKGPDMLSPLPSVLSPFRERRVGFGGDVKEMYHQLRIRKEDKQAQRFLFFTEPGDSEPQVYVMDVATFGSTCSPCSAQFIKNLNAEEFSGQFPDAFDAITNRHYVDDYYDSADTPSEAVKLAKEVKYVHSRGGFHIRNWVSNSEAFVQEMGEEDIVHTVHLKDKAAGTDRVLGIIWNTKDDTFSFVAPSRKNDDEHPTKRGILSCVMSVFDPMGLLSPFTVLGKMLIQDLWRTGCEWDAPIDKISLVKWQNWVQQMSMIEAVRIPRAYFGDATTDQLREIQLHVFTDASEAAYGCAAYFRVVVRGEVRCVLVMSRTKVAPLKQLTVPRLELQAAVLGARLAKMVCSNHRIVITKQIFWCDSQTVLSWIRSDQRRYKPFVGFRIGEILELTRLSDWRWVPTNHNVADKLTKKSREWDFEVGSTWFNGPKFLYQDEAEWPQQPAIPTIVEEDLRAVYLFHDIAIPQPLVDVQRIDKWTVLVRVMACVFRFISNCKIKKEGLPIETLKPTKQQEKVLLNCGTAIRTPLKQDEFRKAECFLIKTAQAEAYADELKVLLKNQGQPSDRWYALEKSSPLYKITPMIDSDGIIRMEGRAKDAEALPFDLRFPIILPKGHEVTRKLVQHYHKRCGHTFRETVKNYLRQRYYIENVNAVVKKVSASCIWCKVHRNQPRIPRMAPLPIERLSPHLRSFSYVGVDYFGPIEVIVGRSRQKRWVVLFTCLVVRAVHLEIAYDLSAASCLMAIRRLVCRRGPPLEFISDNGTNLKAASKEIIEKIRFIEEECAEAVTDARTRWKFIPPATPHMGGSWERLVRTVKDALRAFDDGKRLTDEILQTSIAEAEDLVNSRPLTYVAEGSIDALSPNHFLKGVSPNEPLMVPPPPHSAEALRNAYHRSQQLAEELWRRWIQEYVPMINRRSKWFSEAQPLKVGDVVYVVDGKNRKLWVRGIVEELITSKDGRIRQAWVRTNSGVFRRATVKLAVLEINGGNAGPDEGIGPGLRVGDLLGATPLGLPIAPGEKCDRESDGPI